ncbi:MAG: Eco57I restriction-modification methylase domain-containing protein [Synergistaceae bacterium]|jgi:adenine-specific DNA-methyltransferase|nr:Eco57I restriction-modification methylase domain-containing protein [Synergistaceae bacterium]
MLDYVVEQTDRFISTKSKAERKDLGQFFTSKATARFMSGLFNIPQKETLKILDPGAGSGILSAALVEAVQCRSDRVKEIELTCYETNSDVLALLEANIRYMERISKVKLAASVIKDNYLLSQFDDFSATLTASANPSKFDMVIGNPPYFKLAKESPEAVSMQSICYGAPNIYFLFAAMSLFNLRYGGELVYIVPRSWTSGAYFTRFRSYFLDQGRLTDIHIFKSRDKVFDKEDVLQETMIMKLKKTNIAPATIKITSSVDSSDFADITELDTPYDLIVSGVDRYVYLITSQEEIEVLQKVNSFENTMPSIGLKMKTGLTVDFRNKNLLRNASGDHIVPLFYSQHLKGGRVIFPIGKEHEYMSDELPSMTQPNYNYLFVKRFTAKEERRRLQCAIYLARHYPEYRKISTQNKINFVDALDKSAMSEELVCGLYTVINSSLYDKYYRVLNGSTQVNATEMNAIPVPTRSGLEFLGREMVKHGDYSTAYCDKILEKVING